MSSNKCGQSYDLSLEEEFLTKFRVLKEEKAVQLSERRLNHAVPLEKNLPSTFIRAVAACLSWFRVHTTKLG
jgi:hypothetical protein